MLDDKIQRRSRKSHGFKAAYVQVGDIVQAIKEVEHQSVGLESGVGAGRGIPRDRHETHDESNWFGGSLGESSGACGTSEEACHTLGRGGEMSRTRDEMVETLGRISGICGGVQEALGVGANAGRGTSGSLGGETNGGTLNKLAGYAETALDSVSTDKQEEFGGADFWDKSCNCPMPLHAALSRLHRGLSDREGLSILQAILKNAELTALCHKHLRHLGADGFGLFNNESGQLIRRRLQQVFRFRHKFNKLRCRKPHWFRKTHRPTLSQDLRGTCRYDQTPVPDFDFDPMQVFERFARVGSWETWIAEGSIIIPDIFYYLEEAELQEMIDKEFAIYRHHHHTPSGTSRLGWLRNMYYSLLQQLCRQDPVWYALTAAARPDRGWRLISYPYITKDTGSKGEDRRPATPWLLP